MVVGNIFEAVPKNLDKEVFDLLVQKGNVKIERIVSKGHTSPESGWHEQEQDEWVMVLKGEATISFEDSKEVNLKPGSHITIPAQAKHKVVWTEPKTETIWLAIHY